MRPVRLLHVVGTRPNFMKMAPVIRAVDERNAAAVNSGSPEDVVFHQTLVHTGQHYDREMSDVFFADLGLPEPSFELGVGSGSHARQTADVMIALEPLLVSQRSDLLIVAGDVNSTLAAALAAAKLTVPVAHVEAGLRSRDRAMPEEVNRVLTDHLSDLLFATCEDAVENLLGEGIPEERIRFVGNPMIDTLESQRDRALSVPLPSSLEVRAHAYALVTLHRPSNVDDPRQLSRLWCALAQIAERLPVVFPVHARTRDRLDHLLSQERVRANPSVRLCSPLGYLDFLGLMARAGVVLTDSGGVQEETTVLGVPCLTLRTTTERPVTVTQGTNRLVAPDDVQAIVDAALAAVGEPARAARRPALWDGKAAIRIVDALAAWAGGGRRGSDVLG